MKRIALSLLALSLFTCKNTTPPLDGPGLLDKAISYHDPHGNWPSFDGQLEVTMETPNASPRISHIAIDLPNDVFSVEAKRDTISTGYTLKKDVCEIRFNGSTEFTDSIAKANRLSCERGRMYKDYYTYLYGLPMKLKDPGTHIDPTVETKHFKGKDYLVLKASYEATVGSDVWYFYFDPNTYAMEIYQFYKTDGTGTVLNDSGEYILLTEEHLVNGIKMPKNRAWYYNKDDKYLGTDVLK